MPKKIQAVIFDMDGVIFDSERTWKKADVSADVKFSTGFDETVRSRCCGRDEKSVRAYLRSIAPDLDVDAYRDYIINYVKQEEARVGAPIKTGFIELVGKLKSRGILLGLATSSRRERARQLFEKAGLDRTDIFDTEVYGEDVSVSKPDPEIFLLASRRLGVKPAHTVVIEDSPNGIAAAFSGGFDTVMVIDLIPPPPEYVRKGLVVYDALSDVIIP